MKQIIQKFTHPIRGMWYAVCYDRGMQAVLLVGGLGVLGIQYLFGPISDNGNLLLALCFILVVITELQNSATEAALDAIHPEYNEKIGRSKDMASAAVACAAAFSALCAIYIATGRI